MVGAAPAVLWTWSVEEPEAERSAVGVGAREKIVVMWAGRSLVSAFGR